MVQVYDSSLSGVVGFINPYYALVTKNKNNILYCDMECICTAENEKYFKEGSLIKVNGIHGGIFRLSNPTSTGKRLKARCNSLYEDAKNYTIQNLVLDNEPVSTALDKLIEACDSKPIINLFTDFPDDVTVTCTFTNTTLSGALETIAELTGGFLKTVANYIHLNQSLGATLVNELRYGNNIKTFKKIEDWSNVCTKIMPIGYDGVMLDDVYLESETQYDRPYTKIVEFEQELVVEADIPINSNVYNLVLKSELKSLAEAYLKDHAKPAISYEVEAHIDFDVDAGDILPLKYSKLDIDEDVQVQELKWDAIAQRYKSVKFGEILPSISGLYKDLTVRVSGDLSTESVWHKLRISDNFATYDDKNTNHPEYKKVGNIVSIRGMLTVEGSNTIQTSKDAIQIASGIPEECRPSKNVRILCQGSDMNRWLCTVTTGGNVMLSRYGTTEYGSITSGVWLPIDITYLI